MNNPYFRVFFREIRSVLYQSKEQFISSNLKISKAITVIPINDENNMISNLKKLPGITFHVINHEPVFQVPECSKLSTETFYVSDNKSKSILQRNVLSERQENRTEKNLSFQKTYKQKKEPIDDITILKKKNYESIISKNQKKILNKCLYSEVKNIKTQRTFFFNKLRKRSIYFPNLKSKNLNTFKSAKETSKYTFNNFHEEKTISDNISIVSDIENKAHESTNGDFWLSELELENQIVTAPHLFDFINVSLNFPE